MTALLGWQQATTLESRGYVCGHCGNSLASNVGYWKGANPDGSGNPTWFIYICHHCRKPTFFDGAGQTPGIRFGADVKGIEESTVETLTAFPKMHLPPPS
jgi:hypothetical protein